FDELVCGHIVPLGKQWVGILAA
ncbi:MAG: hypothetical protein HW390_3534, partial [Candidatus Brocadiaceae bacterium]|nr:hypothetical protein [Candidatus Brocadiaceae bacterium]